MPLIESALENVSPNVVADIAITALLIYWLFSLIRGTRAVRLVIGVCLLILVYGAALALDLRLLTVILQTGAYVGLFALVVVFQPELRRALDRIGRLGSLGWLMSPAEQSAAAHVAAEVAAAAARLSSENHGALIVLERETGLQEIAETGVMINADVSADLIATIFWPKTPLHDGAVVIRGDRILAAGAILPSAETTIPLERFGTRHKAALGMTEQTDAVVVVVSEETGQVSLVERARIVRNLDEGRLATSLAALLKPLAAGELLGLDGAQTVTRPSLRRLSLRSRFRNHEGTRTDEGPADERGDADVAMPEPAAVDPAAGSALVDEPASAETAAGSGDHQDSTRAS